MLVKQPWPKPFKILDHRDGRFYYYSKLFTMPPWLLPSCRSFRVSPTDVGLGHGFALDNEMWVEVTHATPEKSFKGHYYSFISATRLTCPGEGLCLLSGLGMKMLELKLTLEHVTWVRNRPQCCKLPRFGNSLLLAAKEPELTGPTGGSQNYIQNPTGHTVWCNELPAVLCISKWCIFPMDSVWFLKVSPWGQK